MAKYTVEGSQGRLASRYTELSADRQPFLDRAREGSLLTIPQLFPPEGTTGSTRFRKPYQSLGSRAVNSLVAKLLLAVLPANQPFYRFDIDEMAMKRLTSKIREMYPDEAQAAQVEATQTKVINEGLAKSERTIQRRIEASTLRSKLSELLKQKVVGGNALLYVPDLKGLRVYRLDSYVVKLDPMGNLIELIVREKVHKLTLKTDVRAACGVTYEKGVNEEIFVYTGVELLENGRYREVQEINAVEVPGSEGEYPRDKLPWLPLRFFAVDGESYSRSYVDEYIGDLESLEGLSKAIVQGAAAAAKVIFLVKGGRTSRRQLAQAANGAFLDGDVNDIGTLKLDKVSDFTVASNTIKNIEGRLASAFLMTTSIQRDGERVTAEEIRRLANELEDQLGGIYSILAQNLQNPLITIVMANMERDGTLPPMPKEVVQVSITTGLEALGRGQDAERLKMFVADLVQLAPTGVAAIRMDTLVSRLAVSRGIDTSDLIKTSAEVAQEQQAAMAQQFMMDAGSKAAPEVIKAGLSQASAPTQ